MKAPIAFSLFAVLLAVAPVTLAQPIRVRPADPTTFDLIADYSHAGRAAIHEGTLPLGAIESTHVRLGIEAAIPIRTRNTLRCGLRVQSLAFHPPALSPLPDTLGSASIHLGFSHVLNSPWSLTAEVNPGNYGNAFGVPAGFRAVYAVSRELQWAAGVTYDWRSGHPILGALGVRWQFAPEWAVSLLLPSPGIEWAATKTLTLFAGASLRDGTFRVARDFGRARARPALDGQMVDYREISAGAGAWWQFAPNTALHLTVGRMLDRRFEYAQRNLLLNGDGAASGQLALSAAW